MKDKFLQYLQIEKRYSFLTIQSYGKDLDDLENFLLKTENISIDDAEIIHLRNFIVNLSEKKLSEKTINRKISTIRSFYKFLLRIGKISKNPTNILKNLKAKKIAIVPFSEEEIFKLEEIINDIPFETTFETLRNKLIFHLFYQTGIRRMELINIKSDQVNFSASTINIIGKRNKEREIPIEHRLSEEIKIYIKERNDFIKADKGYLLCDEKGDNLKEKFVYQLINFYLSNVTNKQKKGPHMLRHTFATHLLKNGADINSIKELLGHTSLSATQVYMHNNIENLKKIVNQTHPNGEKIK